MAGANGVGRSNKKNVFLRGSTWYVLYPELLDDGSTYRRWKGGHATEGEAKEFFEQMNNKYLEMRENVYIEDVNTTTYEYLVHWFENVYIMQIDSNTELPYRYTLYNYILPNLDPNLKLRDLNKSYLEQLFRIIGKLMPSYAKKAKELFRVCLNTALIDQMVKYNCAVRAKLPRVSHKKVIIPMPDQIGEMLRLAEQTDTYLEFLLAITLGLRKGEVYGLKIADIDFQMRVLHINRQVTHKQVFTDKVKSYVEPIEKAPKRDSYRSIHIPDFIMEEIIKRKERIDTVDKLRSNYEDNDYLCGQRNGKARAGSCLNNALDRITKKLGMPKMAFHHLRHVAATIMLENGIQLTTIAKILGHSSVETTYRIYCDVMTAWNQITKTMDELLIEQGHEEVA